MRTSKLVVLQQANLAKFKAKHRDAAVNLKVLDAFMKCTSKTQVKRLLGFLKK